MYKLLALGVFGALFLGLVATGSILGDKIEERIRQENEFQKEINKSSKNNFDPTDCEKTSDWLITDCENNKWRQTFIMICEQSYTIEYCKCGVESLDPNEEGYLPNVIWANKAILDNWRPTQDDPEPPTDLSREDTIALHAYRFGTDPGNVPAIFAACGAAAVR
jgi:hypothetical protein